MIKAKALKELLKKTLKNGVDLVFICNHSGGILAKEGIDSGSTITDVVSTIWTDYDAVGDGFLKKETLNFLILENEDSFIVATHLFGFIVCMKARNNANLGLVKIHLEGLTKFLHSKLKDYIHLIDKSTNASENIDN